MARSGVFCRRFCWLPEFSYVLLGSTPKRVAPRNSAIGDLIRAFDGVAEVNAVVCALIATAFWSLLGYALLGSRLVPRVLAIGAAPVIGWSVHSAASLPIYLLFGFSPFVVAGIGAVFVLVAGFSLSQPRSAGEIEPPPDHSGVGVRRRRGGRASACGDHPPKVFRWCLLACRRDVRPCKNRDCRCDDAPRSAAGQSRAWRSRYIERLGLLLSLAFQRRRDCARHVNERLGSRRRSDLVHSVRLAQLDDGARRVAEQTRYRGDLGGGASRSRFAVGDGLLVFQVKSFAPVLMPPTGMAGWLFQATWVQPNI